MQVIILNGNGTNQVTTETLEAIRQNEGLTVCLLGKDDPIGDVERMYDDFIKGYNTSLSTVFEGNLVSLIKESGPSFEKFSRLLSAEQKDGFLFQNFFFLLPVLEAMAENRGISAVVGNVRANNNFGLMSLLRLFGRKSILDHSIRLVDTFKYTYHYGKFLSFVSGKQILKHFHVETQTDNPCGHIFVSEVAEESVGDVMLKVERSGLVLHLQNQMKESFEIFEI